MASHLLESWQPGTGGNIVTDLEGYEQMRINALAMMLPVIKPRMSLVNSLLELKDIKGIAKLLSKNLGALRSIGRMTLRQAQKAVRKPSSLVPAADGVASNYLTWMFGVKPLVSDIVALFQSLTKVEAELRHLLNNEQKPQVMRVSWPFGQNTRVPLSGGHQLIYVNNVDYINAYTSYGGYCITELGRFHATLRYSYQFSELQRAHGSVLSLLDSLGVRLDASIIWNAIPFSFVVDWVFNVGNYLETFSTPNMMPRINITSYVTSHVRKRHCITYWTHTDKVFAQWWDPTSNYPPEVLYYPPIVESAYKRDVRLPGAADVCSSGLNATEFTLGAALVVANRPKFRKPRPLKAYKTR
jgi:hypothetical protein